MKQSLTVTIAVLMVAIQAQGQADRDHPFWKFKARDEHRWLLEKAIKSTKYYNDHHKKAVKAAKEGNWGMSLLEYEEAARSIKYRVEESKNGSAVIGNLSGPAEAVESAYLSPFRFELALAYANRADELRSFGRSREADSLSQLAVFHLARVEVFAVSRMSAGATFASLASAYSRLGHHESAVRYYRSALLQIEGATDMTNPLQAVVNVRLGQEYLVMGQPYESEPPLLRGTEFADSASLIKSQAHWCQQLASEGRAYLGEACRQMQRPHEAESLFAVSMDMALRSDPPMIIPQCRPLYENYAALLRERGAIDSADSVNYRTDLIQRRSEREIDRLRDEKK